MIFAKKPTRQYNVFMNPKIALNIVVDDIKAKRIYKEKFKEEDVTNQRQDPQTNILYTTYTIPFWDDNKKEEIIIESCECRNKEDAQFNAALRAVLRLSEYTSDSSIARRFVESHNLANIPEKDMTAEKFTASYFISPDVQAMIIDKLPKERERLNIANIENRGLEAVMERHYARKK
jgi:hypothetical protein